VPAEIPKVPEDEFNRIIRALLKAPPLPMTDITRKGNGKAQTKRSRPKKQP
jgi:hypothetical protein